MATVNRHDSSTEGTIVPSLLDYLRVLGRRKFLFLLIVILVPATAVAVSLNQESKYQASAVVYLQPQALGTSSDPERVAQTLAELARSPSVVDKALDAVPGAGLDREEFLESSSVSAALGRDILTFSVEHSDPQLARQLATEYAKAFTEFQEELESEALANTLAEVRERIAEAEANGEGPGSPNYDALKRQEENLAAAASSETRSARVVSPGDEAPKVSPRTLRNGVIAFCLGLALALVVVFLADALDTRVKSVDAIREALGLRLLGRLGPPPSRLRKRNGLVMLADPTGRESDQFRALRWSLDLANSEQGARTIMITSALDGEGKSTTVANLAVALARAGRRVVVVDADLAKPHLHRLFNIDQQPGLMDVELGEAWLTDTLVSISVIENSAGTDDAGRRLERTGTLEVLPAGSTVEDPDELGSDRAIGQIIRRVRSRADVVLVDAPPLLRSNAIALSPDVDAIVVVVRLKALREEALQEMVWMLEAAPAAKLGFVATGAGTREGYGYGHQPRLVVSGPEATPSAHTVSPSTADGDGKTPAQAPSKSASRPFGGLSPREAGLRSAQSRRAKSARRAAAAERAEIDVAQDGHEDD